MPNEREESHTVHWISCLSKQLGDLVVLTQSDVIFTERIGHSSHSQLLPVGCQGHGDIPTTLSRLQDCPALYPHRIHVLATHQPPYAPRCVYLGQLGLRGGMPKPDYYVSVADNSDSDDKQVVDRQTNNGIQVSFRPDSDGE